MATLLPYDPVPAALEAVAAHIKSRFPDAVSIRGPEEFPEDYDGGVVFSIVELSLEREDLMAPSLVDQNNTTDISADPLYKMAQLTIRAQVTMWTDYRFTQAAQGGVVEGGGALQKSLWHNRLPRKGGLDLTSDLYHDRPLTITAGGGVAEQDPDEVADGMWRRVWDLVILTDLVARQIGAPRAAEIIIELSTELGPDTVQEPDLTIPAPAP